MRSPPAAFSTLDGLEAREKSLATLADRGRAARVLVLAVLDSRRSLEDILLDRLIRTDRGEP